MEKETRFKKSSYGKGSVIWTRGGNKSCIKLWQEICSSWQDIDALESLSKALSPVADLTDFLSGEKHISTLSVLPVLYNLTTKVLVEQDNDTELTKLLRRLLNRWMLVTLIPKWKSY